MCVCGGGGGGGGGWRRAVSNKHCLLTFLVIIFLKCGEYTL